MNSLVQLTQVLTQYYEGLRGWSVPGNKIINLIKKRKETIKSYIFRANTTFVSKHHVVGLVSALGN